MKRANWIYFAATAVMLVTGVSVAGAKQTHHSSLARSGARITAGHRWHGRLVLHTPRLTVAPTPTTPTTTGTTTTGGTASGGGTTTGSDTPTTTTTTAPPAPPTTTGPTTPPAESVGAFLSYPNQSATTTINGGTNVELSSKSYQGFSGKVAVTVSGAHNVYLHDLDFADNGGDIFLVNCTGQIRIENIRARNTGDGSIGSGHSNVIQLNNTWDDGSGGIRNVRAYGGHTEDMISIFKSGGTDAAHPLIIENNHLESPLPPSSMAWASGSGSGMMLADGGGHDIIVRNNTLLNVGQVGIGINEGLRVHVLNNIVYGAARASSNVGLSQWASGTCSSCGGNEMNGNRVWWVKSDGTPSAFWSSGTAGAISGSNSLQDTSIDPATLHVVL